MSLEVFHCTTDEEKTAPLKARDYKDPLVVMYELSKGSGQLDGEWLQQTRHSRSDERYVHNGDTE